MKKTRKIVSMALATALVTSAFVPSFAAIEKVVATDAQGNDYQYDLDALDASYLAYQMDSTLEAAELYKDFNQYTPTAFKDSVKGYVTVQSVEDAYLAAQISGEDFDPDQFAESGEATAAPAANTDKLNDVTVVNGEVVVTPVEEGLVVESVSAITEAGVTTVTADVLNAEEGATAKVEIFANGDTEAEAAATNADVEIVDGKISTTFEGLPAGTHVARVTVGEVSADAEFTVEEAALAVESVSAINATTVQAVLAEVAVEAPVAGDFTVLVDGAPVEVTAVAKAANTTKTYNLTVASLNNKEGALTVNGTASTIAGSDFGYDFKKPTIASVTGVDKNHVQVVFSEKMNKTDAETVANYELTNVSDGLKLSGAAAKTPTLAKAQADGKTVLLTTDGTMTTFTNGYIATVKTGVKDAKGNATTTDQSTYFSGNGEESTQAPVVLSTVYNPSTTATVVVKFDKDISATVTKSKVTVGGQALALGDTVARTGVAELTITMTTATRTAYEASADKTVVLAAGAVKDTAVTPNEIGATTLTPVEATRLTSATFDEANNKLVMNFNKVIDISTIDLTKVTVNGEVLAASTATGNILTQTADSATLEFTLGDATAGVQAQDTDLTNVEVAAVANRGLAIAAGFATDANGNAVADYNYKNMFAYTDDSVAPVVESVTYNATTNTMVITANEDVTIPDLDKVAVYDGTTKLFDFETKKASISAASKGGAAIADAAASSSKKFTLYLNDSVGTDAGSLIEGSSVNKDNLVVKFIKAGTAGQEALKDIAGNVYAKDADSDVAIAYTDQDPFTIATGADQTGLPANQVKLIYDKSLASADLIPSKFTIYKDGNTGVTVPVTAVNAYNNNKTVVLTMDNTSANYVNGYVYVVSTTAKDIYGNPYLAPANATTGDDVGGADFTLDTTAVGTAYKLTNAVYADTNGNYSADAGDKITLTFDGAVSTSGDVENNDFAFGGGGTPSFGNFTIAAGNQPEELVVTLGAGADITLGTTTVNITATAADKNIVGANGVKVDAKLAPVTFVKPDQTGPKLTSATFTDANGNGIQDAGDTLTMVFNENVAIVAENMKADAVATAGDEFLLSAGDLTLDGTKASVEGDTLTIEIGTVTTAIVPGTTTINGGANAPTAVKDLWGNVIAADVAKTIAKSDTVQPVFSNVRIQKGTGNTAAVLQAGDKVVFDMSEATHLSTAATEGAPDLDALKFYAGATEIKYATDNVTGGLGFGGDGTGGVAGQISVDNSAKTVTVTIAASDGWVGATISALSSFNIDTLGTKTFFDANGNQVKTASGFGLAVTAE